MRAQGWPVTRPPVGGILLADYCLAGVVVRQNDVPRIDQPPGGGVVEDAQARPARPASIGQHDRQALRAQADRAAEIVVGHRGLGGFTGLLLGSTSLALAGRTHCPLIVVRGAAEGDRREVLVGVDLRDGGVAGLLEYAFATAALRKAWLRVVHAWDVPGPLFNGADPLIAREAIAVMQERLADTVAPLRNRHPEVRVIEETPPGRPVAELTERSKRADLLVVGSHKRGGGPHIGSVSHGVIHHAACPVAVVPSAVSPAEEESEDVSLAEEESGDE